MNDEDDDLERMSDVCMCVDFKTNGDHFTLKILYIHTKYLWKSIIISLYMYTYPSRATAPVLSPDLLDIDKLSQSVVWWVLWWRVVITCRWTLYLYTHPFTPSVTHRSVFVALSSPVDGITQRGESSHRVFIKQAWLLTCLFPFLRPDNHFASEQDGVSRYCFNLWCRTQTNYRNV